MPYVGRDGTIGGKKSWSRVIIDFFTSIIDFIGLFFTALTNPPQRHIESNATYGQRNNGRSYNNNNNGGSGSGRRGGSNIRGLKNLPCDANARMGGG